MMAAGVSITWPEARSREQLADPWASCGWVVGKHWLWLWRWYAKKTVWGSQHDRYT